MLTKDSKIVVCSKSFSNNQILRGRLKSYFSNVVFNDTGRVISGQDLIAHLGGAEGAIVGLEKIDKSVLMHLPNLRIIAKYGVGLDGINQFDLKNFNVSLKWEPGVNRRSVSELTLGFMLMGVRNLSESLKFGKNMLWHAMVGQNLSEKTIGIIGFGNIGKDLYSLLLPFKCNILINDINDKFLTNEKCYKFVSKEEIFKSADIITIHVPLTAETRNMIGLKELLQMKKNVILINTARGGIVNEEDLFKALQTRTISSAYFDVMAIEPPDGSDLIKLDNFYVTPHIGGSTEESILSMGISAINGLVDSLIIY